MAQKTTDTALKLLETPLRLTLAGLWAERLCRAFWPLWSITIISVAFLVIIFMMNQLPNRSDVAAKFPTLVYQALVGSRASAVVQR